MIRLTEGWYEQADWRGMSRLTEGWSKQADWKRWYEQVDRRLV